MMPMLLALIDSHVDPDMWLATSSKMTRSTPTPMTTDNHCGAFEGEPRPQLCHWMNSAQSNNPN